MSHDSKDRLRIEEMVSFRSVRHRQFAFHCERSSKAEVSGDERSVTNLLDDDMLTPPPRSQIERKKPIQ